MGRCTHGSKGGPVAVVVLALLVAGCASDRRRQPSVAAPVDGEDRCDLGFNTATFNEDSVEAHRGHDPSAMADVDFSLEEWAEVFVDEELGLTVEAAVDEIEADEIYRRHVVEGVLTHTLDPDPWMPLTERRECDALAAELSEARAAAARHPTVAEALVDGYVLGDRYFAGLGVHYQNYGYLGGFEPSNPVQFLYDGTDADSTLVGLSYVVLLDGDIPPEGFTGGNDAWHRHRSFCLDQDNGAVNLSSDVLTQDECAAIGGTHVPNTNLWMLHVWVVPGCESDWGVFSGANPRLSYLPDGAPFGSGCNTGRDIAEPLAFDRQGDGPSVE